MLRTQMKYLTCLLLLVGLIQDSVAPPAVKTKEPEKKHSTEEEEKQDHFDKLGVEYERYLQEVVETLETDPEFRKKLETAEEADFRNGRVAAELEYVNHHVRTKLDELKRTELNRLKRLVKEAHESGYNEIDPSIMHSPEHIDHTNPHSFEVADLHKLINKVAHDLSEADKKRREQFKEYELQKKFEQEEKMKMMTETEKEEYKKQLEEQKKKHAQHAPIHHPGSKAQLEEVWEKQDHMVHQEFNPKTFFYLHDLDGNGYWDVDETKALFKKELDKMYQAGLPEDDMKEREEEMERMREHVFKETDTNNDMLITLQEFLDHTRKQEFYRDEGWKTVDQEQVYTPEEYREFEMRRQREIQKLIEQGVLPQHPHGYPAHHPQMGHYQQMAPQQGMHPNQGYGHGMPQGVHPGQMGQHPGQMGQHPGQMGQHPGQMGQHSGQMGQHPGQMAHGQHQIPQGMVHQMPQGGGQMQGMGQHPSQMPQLMAQHPNQIPQGMAQLPNQMQQGMPQHPNQVSQGMGQHSNQMAQGMVHSSNQMAQDMAHPSNQMAQGMAHPSNQMAQGMAHPAQIQQGMLQHPSQLPQGIPQQLPQGMAQQSNQISQGMVQGMSHPDKISQGMGQHPNQYQPGMGQMPGQQQHPGMMPSNMPSQYNNQMAQQGQAGQFQQTNKAQAEAKGDKVANTENRNNPQFGVNPKQPM